MSYEDHRVHLNRELATQAMKAAAEAEQKGNPYMVLAYLALAKRHEEYVLEAQRWQQAVG